MAEIRFLIFTNRDPVSRLIQDSGPNFQRDIAPILRTSSEITTIYEFRPPSLLKRLFGHHRSIVIRHDAPVKNLSLGDLDGLIFGSTAGHLEIFYGTNDISLLDRLIVRWPHVSESAIDAKDLGKLGYMEDFLETGRGSKRGDFFFSFGHTADPMYLIGNSLDIREVLARFRRKKAIS